MAGIEARGRHADTGTSCRISAPSCHVRFVDGVRGPVLAGIGRHYGIGLFAAVRDGE
jgi:hypothetical protein